MLGFPIKGSMPFWNGKGFLYCSSRGEVGHRYGGSSVVLERWRVESAAGVRIEVAQPDIAVNPFIKGDSIYFSGCVMEDDEPLVFKNYRLRPNHLPTMVRKDKQGGITVRGNRFSYRGVERSFPEEARILRAIPCDDQMLSQYSPLIFTILEGGEVRSLLYRVSDDSFWNIAKKGSDEGIMYPTIYDGMMAHVVMIRGEHTIVLSTPDIL